MMPATMRERWKRSPAIAGFGEVAADLVGQAAAAGVRLEARDGGRLWADRPNRLPAALRDSLAAHRPAVLLALAGAQAAHRPARATGEPSIPPVPLGVPLDWCEGVMLLAGRPAPDGITAPRWRAFRATTVRLLHDHGAELHNAGWDALDLFGLHATAPVTHAPGWGMAWLLGAAGEVLDVSPVAVGMTREAGGARLAYRKTQTPPRAGCLPAWNLPGASA